MQMLCTSFNFSEAVFFQFSNSYSQIASTTTSALSLFHIICVLMDEPKLFAVLAI